VKAGDLVRIKGPDNAFNQVGATSTWPDCFGQIGVIVAEAKRLYIPAAKVMILGEIAEFDQDELEVISESR
jgi:hypothetical protein